LSVPKISSSDAPALTVLGSQLADLAVSLDRSDDWPAEQLRLCGEQGVFEWFLDPAWGGQGWDELQVVQGYLALSRACLTTTFVITQRTGACRRIAGCQNEALKQRLLPGLASGELFATVGISHLTTSRRHLKKPVLTATRSSNGYRLEGMAPWVTGAVAADVLVLGATLVENGQPTERQLLMAVPTNLSGIMVEEPFDLVGVSASKTGPVRLGGVEVSEDWLIAEPVENVMGSGLGASTGGHETSTLAIGLAHAAINFLADEASRREDLQAPLDALRKEHDYLESDLLAICKSEPACSREVLRQRANSLVLRATQAALTAAKGTGYVRGHPAGRWCREALFFLVWSCPQPVATANLCELAGIEG